MRVAIVGSRNFNDYDFFIDMVTAYEVAYGLISTIISGGAKGADALAKQFAIKHGVTYIEFPADWDKHGKSAGYKRNLDIINACDRVIAFWDGKSKGTKHTIDIAKKQGKKVTIIEVLDYEQKTIY